MVVFLIAFAAATTQELPAEAGPAPAEPLPEETEETPAEKGPAPAEPLPEETPAEKGPAPTEPRFAVRGRVVARGTRQPLEGASISVGTELSVQAGDGGRFELFLPAGTFILRFQHPGFELQSVRCEVRGAGTPELLVRLQPTLSGERFETVVVAPEKQAERIALREEELTRTPGSMGDPLRVIESLPGVAQVMWPVALYNVRGANPGNTGMFLDGVRLPALYHFALGPSVVHPFFIDRVDFYPGGYPARYGRYVSGIVSAETTTPTVDRTRGSVDLRIFDVGGIVATPLNEGRTTLALSGRYSYSGYLLSLLSSEFALSYWDYQGRLEHRLGPGRLTVFAFGSADALTRKLARPGRPPVDPVNAKLRFHRVNLEWRGPVGGGRLRTTLLFGHDRSESFIPQVNNLPVGVTSILGFGRVIYTRPLGATTEIEGGLDGEIQRLNPDSVPVNLPEQDILRRRVALMSGAFLALNWDPNPRFLFSAGLRADLFAEEGVTRLFPGPRLNLRLRASDTIWLKGSLGRFAQMPSLPVSVPGFENFGLRSLGLQSSVQGSVGVEATLQEHASVEANAFVQRMDVTDLGSIFNYDIQAPLLEMRPGRSYGVELMVRRPLLNRLHGWLAYTLSKSERALPPYFERVASDWDQRHILNLVASYRLDGGYQIGSRFRYNTGRPYPVFNKRSLVDDVQAVSYSKLPDFYQFDLRFDRRWIFDRYVLDAYVELINATLTEQVFDLKVRADGSTERVGFRVVLPSVGLHVEW